MEDDQSVISSGQVITPESVVSRNFASAFRGFHPVEVKQFLQRVADEMAAAAEREVELRRALQEALARASHPELDEATVTNILGEHAAKLLASARDTAATITAEAHQQAHATLRDVEAKVARMRQEADGLMAKRVAEADTVADSIRHDAQAAAQAAIDRATQQGKEMVNEARAVRERMLADLTRRRRSVQLQIEQLLAARDRLMAAYDVVRRTVEEATAELDAAEPEARLAAEAVGRRSDDVEVGGRQDPAPFLSPAPAPAVPAATPDRRRPEAPASSLFRRIDQTKPFSAPAEGPRLRPQSVAGAVAGRLPAPADRPPAPQVPSPAASPEPVSELSTMEVPIVSADGPPPPAAAVDELFARIRATEGENRVQEAPPERERPPAPPAPDVPAPVDPVVGERALEGRDELLENLEAGLARALKRVLGDEQNEVLDALRRLGAGAGVLPDADVQAANYRDAARPWLQQAARAGAGFVSDPGSESEPPTPSVDAQATALAAELVEPLRARLSRALEGGADAGEPSVAAESMRATYRQWKVQQVEECARHHVMAAFSTGAFEATPQVASLQWLVDDGGHCPDCDDNALAGPTAKGQPFPTGQLHPPAHPGCRCLLVPVNA
jgi:DivIVA domain-containing protein